MLTGKWPTDWCKSMATITVTTDPVSVAAELGLTPAANSVAWLGTAQNVDPSETVLRVRSATKPTPGVSAFRHPPGDRWRMTLYGDLPTWLWVADGEAVVVLEDGIPGY